LTAWSTGQLAPPGDQQPKRLNTIGSRYIMLVSFASPQAQAAVQAARRTCSNQTVMKS